MMTRKYEYVRCWEKREKRDGHEMLRCVQASRINGTRERDWEAAKDADNAEHEKFHKQSLPLCNVSLVYNPPVKIRRSLAFSS